MGENILKIGDEVEIDNGKKCFVTDAFNLNDIAYDIVVMLDEKGEPIENSFALVEEQLKEGELYLEVVQNKERVKKIIEAYLKKTINQLKKN